MDRNRIAYIDENSGMMRDDGGLGINNFSEIERLYELSVLHRYDGRDQMRDAVSGVPAYGWRCQTCGEVMDSLIDPHRQWHLEPRACWTRIPMSFC